MNSLISLKTLTRAAPAAIRSVPAPAAQTSRGVCAAGASPGFEQGATAFGACAGQRLSDDDHTRVMAGIAWT